MESLTEVEKLQSKDWIELAEKSVLFGHPVKDLDREGLLAMIGCLSKQLEESLCTQLKLSKRS